MSVNITNPIYSNEDLAREHLESILWPTGAYCPRCGATEARVTKLEGKSTRPGVYKCKDCRKPFSVTVGTVMERSKIPLTKWVLAAHLMASSKKGMSAHQLHRSLGVTYKTAWFLAHRIRAAMRAGGLVGPLGGAGKVVEADETYYGKVENPLTARTDGRPFTKGGIGTANKRAIVALVERGGSVRTFHVAEANRQTVEKIVRENVHPDSRLHTDESRLYPRVGKEFAAHETVKHSAGEYARGDVHNNNAEAFFGVFKKGMRGVYQHCAEKHLHRYLDEFSFRHNTRTKLGFTDTMRAEIAVEGIEGKRLTYRRTNGEAVA